MKEEDFFFKRIYSQIRINGVCNKIVDYLKDLNFTNNKNKDIWEWGDKKLWMINFTVSFSCDFLFQQVQSLIS